MLLKFVSAAVVTLSFNLANAESLDSVKIFDGMAVHCASAENLGAEGYLFNDVKVSQQNEGDFVLSMNLSDVICKKNGDKVKWSSLDKSPYGTHRQVGLDGNEYDVTNNSEVLAYTSDYKVFSTVINAQQIGDLNVAIDVRLVDVLSATERDSLNRSGKVIVPVFLAKRSLVEFKDLSGRIVAQNYFVGGVFKVLVTIEKSENGQFFVSVK